MKPSIFLTAFAVVASCMRAPPVCLSNILELDAGVSFVSASIDGSFTRRCEASVTLDDDPEFLPVTYTFDASHCDSSFLASFQVPRGFSAGLGYIFWQCSGLSPTCNRIRVKSGQKDPNVALQMQGSVQCATKLTRTPTMTITTGQSSTTSPGASTVTGGGNPSWSSGDDAPTPYTLPIDGASSVTTSSTGVWPTRTSSNGVWLTGATYTGAVTGATSNSQRSMSTTPAINDATAINARQTAITSTFFTTILLTQTITAIATVC